MDPRYQQQPQPQPQQYQQAQPYQQVQQYQQQQPQQYQQQQQQRQRPQSRIRSKSGFSFRSDKTSSSNNSHKRKESLQETTNEKRKTHMSATTKANPNAAINEAQPVALALEKPTLSSLQNVRCSDVYGNFISDPDRSNPTRWRMERPLETIKSFEIAIDKAYAQRQSSYIQSPGGLQSQRSSSHWGNSPNGNGENGRFSNFSANGSRGTSREELSNYEYSAPPVRHPQRMQSDPSRGYGPPGPGYSGINNTRSRDTLNTGNSSGSEQWNNSTNPTNDEGSMERANGFGGQMPGPQYSNYNDNYQSGYSDEEYGNGRNNGYPPRQASMGQQAPTGYGSYGNNGGYYPNQQGGAAVPRVPIKDTRPAPPPKNVIALSSNNIPNGAVQPPQQKQRSSWFKKRFSRGGQ